MDQPEPSEPAEVPPQSGAPNTPFKKPILIGKIGRLPRKITKTEKKPASPPPIEDRPTDPNETNEAASHLDIPPEPPAEKAAEPSAPLAYREPSWSGAPTSAGKGYFFEVLKNGLIIETIDLMSRPFWVFGRLPVCNICMQHPTISRYHAVLQYRSEKGETEDVGFYIYDLSSTHGTFLNKNKLKSRVYARIQVGHMLKLGCSTRTYILNGPDEDAEEESELSVTELKLRRQAELQKREEEEKEAALERQRKEEEMKRKQEEKGVDWGLGEDADEETDLSENPFAQTNNEDLYLDNPKKALRGFFEREGLELEYDCTEQGIGQFLCKVELPVDDEMGRPVFAEVVHKGKKKEAVVQCALEACRVLDRHGLLRQATHESRKRKPKNWEENDYYDSDDDTFLDRTGTVEKKREMRMKAKAPPKAETYESLLEKENEIKNAISKVQVELQEAQRRFDAQSGSNSEEDSLDLFMNELKHSKPDRQSVNKLKADLSKLKQEHLEVVRLVNIARPASLPPLVVDHASIPGTSGSSVKSKQLPIFGKRKKMKLQLPTRSGENRAAVDECAEEEYDDDEEDDEPEPGAGRNDESQTASGSGADQGSNAADGQPETSADNRLSSSDDEASYNCGDSSSSNNYNLLTLKKFEKILNKQKLPPFADKHQEKFSKILHSLKKLASAGDRMDVDWKMLEAKKRKVMKLIRDMNSSEPDEKLEYRVSSELNSILHELNVMTEQKFRVISKVKKMSSELKNISEEINTDLQKFRETKDQTQAMETGDDGSDEEAGESSSDPEKKRKKNQRRTQQRQDRAEMERQKGYAEDSRREDYNMWVPPSNQSGDGRTELNDKYGY